MRLSLGALLLWAAGFCLNAALVFVLFRKRRHRIVPWFTMWMILDLVYSVALFLAFRFGSKHLYAVLYWTSDFLDVLLQIAVIVEIAGYILKRSGRWVEGSKVPLTMMAATAPLIALIMAVLMKPAAETRLDAWAARSSLFTTVMVSVLFTGVLVLSQQLGLNWRNLVLREGYGLMVWELVAFVTDTLHAYWRTAEHFSALEHLRMVVYLGSLLYWCTIFWLPEQQLTPDIVVKKQLADLRARLE